MDIAGYIVFTLQTKNYLYTPVNSPPSYILSIPISIIIASCKTRFHLIGRGQHFSQVQRLSARESGLGNDDSSLMIAKPRSPILSIDKLDNTIRKFRDAETGICDGLITFDSNENMDANQFANSIVNSVAHE